MDIIYQSLQIIDIIIRDYLLLHDITYLARGCVRKGADVFGLIGLGVHCLRDRIEDIVGG